MAWKANALPRYKEPAEVKSEIAGLKNVLLPGFEKQYICKRKQELVQCPQLTINKSLSVGQCFEGFFSSEHTIYPGRNSVGFRLDDDEMYIKLIQAVQWVANRGGATNGDNSWAISAIRVASPMYLFPEILGDSAVNGQSLSPDRLSEMIQKMDQARKVGEENRKRLFNTKDNSGIVSISDLRHGVACTEMAAMAQNMLLFLGVDSYYCIGGFRRTQVGRVVHDSVKHSYVVFEISPGSWAAYDPHFITSLEPLIVPIDWANMAASCTRIEEDGGQPVSYRFDISNAIKEKCLGAF